MLPLNLCAWCCAVVKVWLSYCHLQRGSYQKNTNIWCDTSDVLECLADPQGKMKRFCTAANPCTDFLSHGSLRPKKGEQGRADRGSIYPDALCSLLTSGAARLFGHVRTQMLDPANTADGSNDRCSGCHGNYSGESFNCNSSGCVETYHYGCIPNGHPKPLKCTTCSRRRRPREDESSRCEDCPPWKCPKHVRDA